jgi:oligoendopeptidase F
MDYKNRNDIPLEYTWDLTTRYANDTEWNKDYLLLIKEIKEISKYEGKVLSSVSNLYNTLEEYFKLSVSLDKLITYAHLKHDEDLSNDTYSLMYNKAYNLYVEFLSLSSFICPEILKGNKTKLVDLLKNKKLSKYHFYLENIIRSKDHTLNINEEKIISKLGINDNVFSKVNSILTDSTLNYGTLIVDGKEVTLTNNNYRNIMTNKNQKVRETCYNLMTSKMKEFSSIFAENLVANMKNYSVTANIRNFKSTLDMQLFSSNIPSKVVDNLYSCVHEKIAVFQKYLALIAKNLGLKELNYYDLNTEFLNSDLTFSIEDAQLLIIEATKIYGTEYNEIIKKAFEERWIDYGSYKGKAGGAYSTSNYGNTPVVLTNFHGKFTDVSAIAHELGHAVNFYLSSKNNPHECNNDIFVAEVASLTNEIILSNYIMQNSKDHNLKLVAIYNLIDIIQNNLFDACLEGELENISYKLIDNKEEINSDTLNTIIYELRTKYYGNKVKLDDNVKYMWARRSHYFYPFYLFEYATGVSAAIYIASKIINNEDNMKIKYMEFLKAGETNYPTELLKAIGVDMTKPKVILNAIDFFNNLLDEFNKESDS